MKNLLIISINILLISCQVQKLPMTQEINTENLEPGKCYFTLQLENEIKEENIVPQKAFTIEIIEPQYQLDEVSYSSTDLKSEMGKNEYLSIQTSKAHTKLLIKDSNLSEFTTIENPKGFMYCLIEVPSEWKTIYKKDLLQDSIKIVKKRIIAKSRILKKYVNKEPKMLKANQLFFESHIWSTPKEAILSGCGGYGYDMIYKVKEALIKLGYELKLNNEFDDDTKDALLDFQRKNQLKEGQLDLKTLEKLGIIINK